jgi:hypothetical protein
MPTKLPAPTIRVHRKRQYVADADRFGMLVTMATIDGEPGLELELSSGWFMYADMTGGRSPTVSFGFATAGAGISACRTLGETLVALAAIAEADEAETNFVDHGPEARR